MVGLAFAAVPLYDLFCRVTGFDGTPIVGTLPAGQGRSTATIAVRFDANVAPGSTGASPRDARRSRPSSARPRPSSTGSRNHGPAPSTGIATFNVQPAQAAAYFVKIQCFCFTEQTLQPGETLDFAGRVLHRSRRSPRPELEASRDRSPSYTYFPAKDGQPSRSAATTADERRRTYNARDKRGRQAF